MPDGDLTTRVRGLEPELQRHLRRRFPDLPAQIRLRFRKPPGSPAHHVFIVETESLPARRVVLKGPVKDWVDWPQSRETELRLLTDVTPRIGALNPAARTPAVLAHYPDLGFVLLEMVDGPTLHARAFGLRAHGSRQDLGRLFRLTGEWLASFHAFTRERTEASPFGWLLDGLTDPERRETHEHAVGARPYGEALELATRLRLRFRDLRRPTCTVHHDFTPWHVLVQGESVYVIDFASSRPGHPHEDLAKFTVALDSLSPWWRALGAARVPIGRLQGEFLSGYASIAGPPDEPDQLAYGLARLLIIARLATRSGPPRSRGARIVHGAAAAVRRRRLRALWCAQLATLQGRARSLDP